MNVYAAIGHFKGNENITCIALMQSSKKEFMTDCYGNEFVPYVVLTEKMLNKIQACTYSMDIFNFTVFSKFRMPTNCSRFY